MPDRVTAVPNGVEERFTPGGERSPTPLVLAVGRSGSGEALPPRPPSRGAARREVPDLRLRLVGDGPLAGELRALGRRPRRRRGGSSSPATSSATQLRDEYRRAWVVLSALTGRGVGAVADRGGGVRDAGGRHGHPRPPLLGGRRGDRAARPAGAARRRAAPPCSPTTRCGGRLGSAAAGPGAHADVGAHGDRGAARCCTPKCVRHRGRRLASPWPMRGVGRHADVQRARQRSARAAAPCAQPSPTPTCSSSTTTAPTGPPTWPPSWRAELGPDRGAAPAGQAGPRQRLPGRFRVRPRPRLRRRRVDGRRPVPRPGRAPRAAAADRRRRRRGDRLALRARRGDGRLAAAPPRCCRGGGTATRRSSCGLQVRDCTSGIPRLPGVGAQGDRPGDRQPPRATPSSPNWCAGWCAPNYG